MADGITLDVAINDQEVRAAFAEIARRGSDPAPAMELVAAALEGATRNRFRTQVSPDGIPWLPSARALAQDGTTLYDEGHLLDSLSARGQAGRAEVGFARVYAAIHNFGGKAGRGHKTTLPARPFLDIGAEDEAEIVAILQGFLAEAPGVSA
jgi:phage virion morphogenesis protein